MAGLTRYRRLTARELKNAGKSTKTVAYKALHGRKIYSRWAFEKKIRPSLQSFQLPTFYAHTKKIATRVPKKTDWIKNLYSHLANPKADFTTWWKENGAVVRGYYLQYEKTGLFHQSPKMKALIKSKAFRELYESEAIPELIGSPDLGDFFDDKETKKAWYEKTKST